VSKPAIVFIGFMGAGKSWAAASVDGLAGGSTDIDELIERRVKMPVREFFDSRGESEFRRVEEEVAVKLLSEADGGAIALGGGSVLSPKIRSELSRHIVVWLDVDAETAWERVSDSDGRPLVARGRELFDALFVERRPKYEALADVVVLSANPGTARRALPSIQALAALPEGTRLLWASSGSGEYPAFVGPGLLDATAAWWPLAGRRFCVTDSAVGGLYGDRIAPLAARVEVDPGEGSKTMAVAERVLRELASAGMTREDHVVALGGGVVGDLAGFCAHTYQRGVPVVQVPTTLVAQVDSAYGGKTGVDLPEGKNYAGAYHLPAAVIADTETLSSLPVADLAAGYVEALKTGLLAGGRLWDRVRQIETLDPADLADVVFACARYKCEVVAADERDSGRRQVLNLGHTVGHAIEAAGGYSRYRHGEAIGLGLLAALRLSEAPALRDEVEAILHRHGLPTTLDAEIDVEEMLAALERDKKRTSAGVGFVLLGEPGEPRIGQLVDPDRVRAAVEELRR
jgi:3-dehydroquinate synthetase/shikimate kinase